MKEIPFVLNTASLSKWVTEIFWRQIPLAGAKSAIRPFVILKKLMRRCVSL